MTTEIQPLHQKQAANSILQRKLQETNSSSKSNGVFASPTDNMLSPCTEKLKNHKSRFFAKSKATKLNFSNLNKQQDFCDQKSFNDENKENENSDEETDPVAVLSSGAKKVRNALQVEDDKVMQYMEMEEI